MKKYKDIDWIEEKVCKIMVNDGPDGHTDGSYTIAEFIVALMNGKEDKWAKEYEEHCKEKARERREWHKRRGY